MLLCWKCRLMQPHDRLAVMTMTREQKIPPRQPQRLHATAGREIFAAMLTWLLWLQLMTKQAMQPSLRPSTGKGPTRQFRFGQVQKK